MLLPLSWLKEYVDVDIPREALKEKLFSCGFEVEEMKDLGEKVSGVYVGKIEKCEKHPDADRLTICTVDLGALGKRQICTAATNVFEGAKVPCALDGATVLKEGGVQRIKTGKLRGALSEGMMCSGEELGITDDFYEGAEVDGILILDETEKVGEDVKKVVGIDDTVFDIAVTANRPDCQSIYGLAREVAAALKKPLKPLDTSFTREKTDVKIPVEVKETKLCPLYVGSYVKDVKIGKSPRLIRRRLALMGLRSVSNIVDITNYVLLEVGQPMHAFDRNFLRGDKIVVRCAEEGEKITTLDEKEFSLHKDNLLICDGERPVAIAGVMGGLNSEIKGDTKEVFFEAACFARDSVRKTSRRLGQRSDSSARFEKGVYEIFAYQGMARALHLVQALGCGTPTSFLTVSDPRGSFESPCIAQKKIQTTYQKIEALLGMKVPEAEANDILKRLGFELLAGKKGELCVAVPAWREDVEDFPDLAEEIVRMYGYEHLRPTFLENARVTRGGFSDSQKEERKLKTLLREQGFFEALNYSFYSPKDFDLLRLDKDAPERKAIKILNPIGEDLSVLRTFLAPSMLANIVRNQRRGNMDGKLFEIANVYLADELPIKARPREGRTLCMGLWGEGDFFDLKGALEAAFEAFKLRLNFRKGERTYLHPGMTAEIYLGEKKIGCLGRLHPELEEALALERQAYLCEVDLTLPYKKFQTEIVYTPLPKFESVRRDLAFVADEKVTCAEAEACILRAVKAVKKAELFDVYRDKKLGAGKKSMAFRLTFAPSETADKLLSPETVDGFFKKIVEALQRDLGAELR